MMRPFLQVKRSRIGFTVLETVVALGLLILALTMTAQLGTWALLERSRADARYEAAEAAANILEAARSLKWSDITPEWCNSQRLADYSSGRLRDAILTVQVKMEARGLKRVNVEIRWPEAMSPPSKPLVMDALFADYQSTRSGVRP
jgi:type II secretory pathway pseudopilin PulG